MSDPVYLLARVPVTDPDAYRSTYIAPLMPQLAAHGAEIVIGGPAADALEGSGEGMSFAVIRFPSRAALDGWYGSEEYAPLKAARAAATDAAGTQLLVFEAFGAPQGRGA